MGYATARNAARENIAVLESHRHKDMIIRALYNISVAIDNLASNVESDLRDVRKDVASAERKIKNRIG